MAICSVPSVKPKHGRLIYMGFILFGVLLSMLTFLPGFKRFFVVHSHFCSRNTSQGKCDALMGHILLYRFYIGMMLFFLILALVNCQLAVFTTFSPWLESGFWFVKFHLFCLSILVALFIPEGHLSNAVMHVGWIGSSIVMTIQLVLIIDLAKNWNTYWVEKMELSTKPNRWYISLLLFTSLLYTLSVSFVVYFYAIYTTSLKDCKTYLVFFTVIVLLCLIASLLSIHPKVRETGLLQAGIVTSYSIYLAWTCIQHYPYSTCNPTWKVLIATDFNFHIQLNTIIDLCTTFLVLLYGVIQMPSVEHLLATIYLRKCYIFRLQSDNEDCPESDDRPLLISTYLMFYLFLILICLHLLMTVSNFYTPEGIVGTEGEVVVSEYKLIDMDEYAKSLSQWVASCLKMVFCVVFLLMYIWTILAPVIFSNVQNDTISSRNFTGGAHFLTRDSWQKKSRRHVGQLVSVNNHKVALFKYKGTAVDEMCPLMGRPLHLGDIEELGQAALPCIVCPWHSWKYCLQTGHLKEPRNRNITLGTYPVRVNDKGEVFVGFKSSLPDYFNCLIDF